MLETQGAIGLLEIWVFRGCGYQEMDLALALNVCVDVGARGPCTVLPP